MRRMVTEITVGRLLLLIPVFVLITSPGMLLPVEVLGGETGVQVLTLEEALRIAAERNRDIQKAREYRNWVEGRYVEERAAALPNFLISMNASESRDETLQAFGAGYPIRQRSRAADLWASPKLFLHGGRWEQRFVRQRSGLQQPTISSASSGRLHCAMSPPPFTISSLPRPSIRSPSRIWNRRPATLTRRRRGLRLELPQTTMSSRGKWRWRYPA